MTKRDYDTSWYVWNHLNIYVWKLWEAAFQITKYREAQSCSHGFRFTNLPLNVKFVLIAFQKKLVLLAIDRAL